MDKANVNYSGLGEVICRKFAAAGSNVAINYSSSEARAVELARQIKEEHGVKVIITKGVGLAILSPYLVYQCSQSAPYTTRTSL